MSASLRKKLVFPFSWCPMVHTATKSSGYKLVEKEVKQYARIDPDP
jgi:hypothetical protein